MEKLHLVKLCVGIDSLAHLRAWRAKNSPIGAETPTQHITRMWPKRESELLDGGSLYWVIKGVIQARQKILRLEEAIGQDGIRRCAIVMDPELVETRPAPRRAFQGWRYLNAGDAPGDLPKVRENDDELPPELSAVLSDIGLR